VKSRFEILAIAKIGELISRFSANSDVAAILDVALEYVLLAKDAPNDKDKESSINRATGFLEKADLGAGQGLPLVKFVHAELKEVQGHNDDAKQYYEDALKIDKDFPRAKVNLGALYATMEPPNFREAAQKFEDVARMSGIPLSTQRAANINLGEADVELGKIDEACSHWVIAAAASEDAPSPFRDRSVFYAHVMCNAARGKIKDAIEEFRSMPHGDEIAEQIRAMGPGPRERCFIESGT